MYNYSEKVVLGLVITILFIVGLLFSLGNKPVSQLFAQEREFFLIDLNKATPEELRLLPFVSDSMAEEIIRYRTEKGGFAGRACPAGGGSPFGFKSIDELSEIKGIGPARLKKMRKYLKDTN